MDHGGGGTSSPGDAMPSTNDSSSHDSAMMKMYLHFTKGDPVLFETIVPSSPGAIFGACLFVFVVAIFDRWLIAYKRKVESTFQRRSTKLISGLGEESSDKLVNTSGNRFILSHELVRGSLTGISTTIHYLLMLVVMTFNVSYIISVVVGAIVGDIAFGRLYRQ